MLSGELGESHFIQLVRDTLTLRMLASLDFSFILIPTFEVSINSITVHFWGGFPTRIIISILNTFNQDISRLLHIKIYLILYSRSQSEGDCVT